MSAKKRPPQAGQGPVKAVLSGAMKPCQYLNYRHINGESKSRSKKIQLFSMAQLTTVDPPPTAWRGLPPTGVFSACLGAPCHAVCAV